MRAAAAVVILSFPLVLGCGEKKPDLREPAVDVKGTVRLPAGVAAKDLVVTFLPTQNTFGVNAKLAADGTFATKLERGNYIYYFSDEVNGNHPSFKKIPEKYRSANKEYSVTVETGKALDIDLR